MADAAPQSDPQPPPDYTDLLRGMGGVKPPQAGGQPFNVPSALQGPPTLRPPGEATPQRAGGNVVSFPGAGMGGGPMAGIDQAVAYKQQVMAPEIAGLKQTMAQGQATVDEAKAKVRPMPDFVAPQPPVYDALKAFGSPGVLFAMIASMFSKTPAIAAMNGAAGAMNAIHAGDREKFEDQYKLWKENTDLALKRHQAESEDLRLAMEQYKDNVSARVAAIGVISANAGDALQAALAKGHMWVELQQLATSRANAAAQMSMQSQRLNAEFEWHKQEMDLKHEELDLKAQMWGAAAGPLTEVTAMDENGQPKQVLAQQLKSGAWVTADSNRTLIDNVISASKPGQGSGMSTVDSVAEKIANNKMAPLTSMALRSPWGQAVMAKVAIINPAYDATQFPTIQGARKAWAYGAQGKQVTATNTAMNHLDTMLQLSVAQANGDIPALNKVFNLIAAETGQPAPTSFEAAKQLVGAEIINAVAGSGGGVSERMEASKNLLQNASPAQMVGVVDTFRTLLAGRLDSLKQQYTQGTHDTETSFNDFLSPSTQKLLKGMPKAQSAPPVAPTVAPGGNPAQLDKGAGAGSFPSPDAVKEAFHSGKLSKDEAAKILRDQFGFQ